MASVLTVVARSVTKLWRLFQIAQWWRLKSSPAEHNDCPKLELPGALCRHCPLSSSKRKSSPCFVPYGDETNSRGDEEDSRGFAMRCDATLAVPCVWRAGGLAMLWKSEVSLDIQTYSLNHIDIHILNDPTIPWRLTGLYGRQEEHRKHESWSYLRHLHSRASLSWVCIGDYNENLTSDEKQRRLPKAGRLMEDFRRALLHCGLIDLGFSGNKFTWRNGRPRDAFVQERLDRAYATVEWRELFPHSKVTHLQAAYSDHDPILLTTQGASQSTRRKKIPKRFEDKWTSHPNCENIILEA